MNKIFTKLIFFCALALTNYGLFAQCTTSIYANRDTIACGESIFLQQTGISGTSSDNFTAGTLSGLWQSVTVGYVIGGPCGTSPLGGQHLWFANGSAAPRTATTVPVDATCGGNICFDMRMETQGGTCDGQHNAPRLGMNRNFSSEYFVHGRGQPTYSLHRHQKGRVPERTLPYPCVSFSRNSLCL